MLALGILIEELIESLLGPDGELKYSEPLVEDDELHSDNDGSESGDDASNNSDDGGSSSDVGNERVEDESGSDSAED